MENVKKINFATTDLASSAPTRLPESSKWQKNIPWDGSELLELLILRYGRADNSGILIGLDESPGSHDDGDGGFRSGLDVGRESSSRISGKVLCRKGGGGAHPVPTGPRLDGACVRRAPFLPRELCDRGATPTGSPCSADGNVWTKRRVDQKLSHCDEWHVYSEISRLGDVW